MKRSKLLGIVCVVAMVAGILVVGCAGEAPPTEGPPTEGPPTEGPPTEEEVFHLTMCTQHPAEDAMNSIINEAWFNWLEQESGGRLQFTLQVNAACAAPSDIYDAARTGIIDIGCQYYGGVTDRFPLQEVTQLPGIFECPGSYSCSMTCSALYDKYPELQAEHPDVKVINFHTSDSSVIATTKKPIHSVEDLEGQQIIVFGGWSAKMIEALGATPVAPGVEEMYDALAKGVADGITGCWSFLVLFHINEVVNYGTEFPGMCRDSFIHVMNLDTWNSLPPDLQDLFEESYWFLPQLFGYQFDKDDVVNRQVLEDDFAARGLPPIYVMSEDEAARVFETCAPVQDIWVEKADALGAPGRDILEDAIMFAEQYQYENTDFEWCEETLSDWGAPGY